MRRLLTFLIALSANVVAVVSPVSAQGFNGGGFNIGLGPFTSGGGTTTLDATFASGANYTLSLGNLKITATSTANDSGRSVASHTSGKFYAEFTIGAGTVNSGFGVACDLMPNTEYVSQNGLHSMGTFGTSWSSVSGGTTTAPALVAGRTYGVAVDVGNGKIWLLDITGGTGQWKANATANPATNVNGAGFAFTDPAIFIAVTVATNGDNSTFNFGATAYAGTPPSGFGNW
jgi:hypothetical protein